MNVHRLLVAVAVVGMLAACTTLRTGSPSPRNTDRSSSPAPRTTSAPTTTPPSTDRLLPPRPRDLDLTGVNPCTDVLTRDQLHRLAYDVGYLDKPIAGKDDIDGGPACSYESASPPDQPRRELGSLIVISTSAGAEVWLTDPRRKRPPDKYRMTNVAGFPALVFPNPVIADNCMVIVDLHDGQYLGVSSSPNGPRGASPEPFCAEAQRVAGMAVETLSARR